LELSVDSRAASPTPHEEFFRSMNTLKIRGDWEIAKGKLRQKFPQLTERDLAYAAGREDELLGRLEQKTGAPREDLEQLICGPGIDVD
jgi:uncharacterized protein YjbJ (UPF0337 family)